MRLGINMPYMHPNGSHPTVEDVRARAKLIEDVGFDGIGPQGIPRATQLRANHKVGLVFTELETRRRLRVNGVLTEADESGFRLSVAEAYPNCPKYIQRRHLAAVDAEQVAGNIARAVRGAEGDRVGRRRVGSDAVRHARQGANPTINRTAGRATGRGIAPNAWAAGSAGCGCRPSPRRRPGRRKCRADRHGPGARRARREPLPAVRRFRPRECPPCTAT